MSVSTEHMAILAKLEQPKSSQGVFELPCGYLDDTGVLHVDIELAELTGNEEDLLASKAIPSHKKMGVLIGRCLRRLGPITDRGRLATMVSDLLAGDRVFLLFALRRLSLGDDFLFKSRCPVCEKEGSYSVDLSSLDIKPMPEPKKRVYDGVLPSGKAYRFRPMSGRDEEQLTRYDRVDDQLSMGMLVRLELLDGKPPTMGDLKALSTRDRDHIREQFDEVDGGVDTSVDITCRFCSCEYNDTINPGQASFFFPSMGRKSLKKRSST